MTEPPLFSVIIPTHARPEYSDACVRSVLGQTVSDLECIVVDDAGPVPFRAPEDPRIRVVRHATNRGSAAARNSGLDAARGRSLIFLDDDDLVEPHRLDVALQGFERAPIAVCWSRTLVGAPTAGRLLEGDVSGTILDGPVPQVGTVAIRRDITERFDPTYRSGEDVEWWLRQARRRPVATVAEPAHVMRLHPGGRYLKGPRHRMDGHVRVLDAYASYFASHPRAAAYRWRRVARLALAARLPRDAAVASLRSLRARPSLRGLKHLARACAAFIQPRRVRT